MKPLLRFEGVTLRRGGQLLLEGLDLRLGPGEALHVTGPNGSGKTSLIRLAAGLLRADAGRVERSALALSDEMLALDRELPLRKALMFWARLGGTADRLAGAMDAMGLAGLAEVPVRLLSSGQAKRATLARVAASEAKLWLLDEPLNGLDANGVERLEALVASHRAAGGAVLAASHSTLGGDWARLELGQGAFA
ncbi:heme ABC exporter ATP-binding protein CcmA [Sphingomonas sp.]|uniref:heme ABC exporter ATP-binding protein CcmA n=1 Tax=Sphingomonas sp. TaxID=28214 RepID=UPI001821BC08|nr:heme ABC exporter ATP-binding protein CcmA [Sphingomonas sp.]MBA3511225.1 heme ABC exporter ATP-binding protein CcmA [Sphingomonas sp.]